MHQTLPNRIIAALRSLSNVNIKHIFVNSTDFSRTVKAHMESKTIKLRRIDRFPQFRAHNIQKRLENVDSWNGSRVNGMAEAGGEVTVAKGYSYRTYAVGRIYNKAGVLLERVTATSKTVAH